MAMADRDGDECGEALESLDEAPLVEPLLDQKKPANGRVRGSLALDAFNFFPVEDGDGAEADFKIPRCVVWSVLTLALVACGFFLVGQLTPMWGLGASINLKFTPESGQDDISQKYEPYKMSLFFSIKCCIETGLVAEVILGIILFFFSGVWPHVKIGLMLFCWFGRVNHRLRHIILYWVDAWGKWSFADPLVVVALMVAFTIGVDLSAGDILFSTIANVVLRVEGLDGTLTADDVESIGIKLDISAAYGIYFFCLGVWLSLVLGSVVEHYNVRLMLLVTADDVLGEGPARHHGSNEVGGSRSRTKWIAALFTVPILPLLVTSYIVPIFEQSIDGVLPMLVAVFGWAEAPNPPSAYHLPFTYGQIFRFLLSQERSAVWIMVVTMVTFSLAAPTFRACVLDLMWYLPSSSAATRNGMTAADYRKRADRILSASNVSSIFDVLAVWLFAVILVHFEIGAISAQIAMPFCNEVTVGAQMLESFCPQLDGFWSSPKFADASKIFSRKHPGWKDSLPDFGGDCDRISSIAEGFNLGECIDIRIGFMAGMWCIVAAVVLAYFSSLLLTYLYSVEVFGRENFEAPVCYRPEGWFCCCCCAGEAKDGAVFTSERNIKHFEFNHKTSTAGFCWCCHRDKNRLE